MPDRTPQTSHRPRRIVVLAVLSSRSSPAPSRPRRRVPKRRSGSRRSRQVTNFDPALMSTQDMGVLIDNVYEGLLGTERDTIRLVPRLAEKWSFSPDGKTLTFTLRKNVKFHDGTALDADAVKFSIDRVKTINKGPAVFIRGISGVEVADKSTVRVRISENPRLALKGAGADHDGEPDGAEGQRGGRGPRPEVDPAEQRGHRALQARRGEAERAPGLHPVRSVLARLDHGPGRAVEYIVQLDPAAARLMLERATWT